MSRMYLDARDTEVDLIVPERLRSSMHNLFHTISTIRKFGPYRMIASSQNRKIFD